MLLWQPADKQTDEQTDDVSNSSGSGASPRTDVATPLTSTNADATSKIIDKTCENGKCQDSPIPAVPSIVNERDREKSKRKIKRVVESLHVDIIGGKFWSEHPDILRGE